MCFSVCVCVSLSVSFSVHASVAVYVGVLAHCVAELSSVVLLRLSNGRRLDSVIHFRMHLAITSRIIDSRVVSVLDSGAEGSEFNRSRDAVG